MSRADMPPTPLNQPNQKKKMKTILSTLSILAIATSLSFAQGPQKGPKGEGRPPRPQPEKVFAKLDADSDGNVTLEEFKTSPRAQENEAKAEEIFAKIDADSDGNITIEEFKAHRPPHARPRKGGKGGPPAAAG